MRHSWLRLDSWPACNPDIDSERMNLERQLSWFAMLARTTAATILSTKTMHRTSWTSL